MSVAGTDRASCGVPGGEAADTAGARAGGPEASARNPGLCLNRKEAQYKLLLVKKKRRT